MRLAKDSAEFLVFKLKEKLFAADISFFWYPNKELEFMSFFSLENELIFCTNISRVMVKFRIKYVSEDRKLFMFRQKKILKTIILHHDNKYASIPVGHSVHLKECSENLEMS